MTGAGRRTAVAAGLTLLLALTAGACASAGPPAAPEQATAPAGVPGSGGAEASSTTAGPEPAAGFGDRQSVAGYTITRVDEPPAAALPAGVGAVAAYDIADGAGAPVARYLRIVPAGGVAAGDPTVAGLLADLAAAHGGGDPQRGEIAGLPSWVVVAGDGTVGIARASEDGPVVVFLGTDRGAVEAMIGAVSAALDSPG